MNFGVCSFCFCSEKKFPSTLFVIFKILFQVGQKTILVIFFLLARLKWYFVVDVFFSFSLYQTFLFFRFITIFFNDFWCHPLFYQLRRWFFLFVFRVYYFDHQKMRFQGNSIKATLISSYFLVKTKGPKKKNSKKKKGSNQWWYFTKTKTSAWIFLCGERVVFLEIRILLSSGSSRRVVLLKSFLFIIFHNYNRKKGGMCYKSQPNHCNSWAGFLSFFFLQMM